MANHKNRELLEFLFRRLRKESDLAEAKMRQALETESDMNGPSA